MSYVPGVPLHAQRFKSAGKRGSRIPPIACRRADSAEFRGCFVPKSVPKRASSGRGVDLLKIPAFPP